MDITAVTDFISGYPLNQCHQCSIATELIRAISGYTKLPLIILHLPYNNTIVFDRCYDLILTFSCEEKELPRLSGEGRGEVTPSSNFQIPPKVLFSFYEKHPYSFLVVNPWHYNSIGATKGFKRRYVYRRSTICIGSA